MHIYLVIDVSGSTGDSAAYLEHMKSGAISFLGRLKGAMPPIEVGLIKHTDVATLVRPLTTNVAQLISDIKGLTHGGQSAWAPAIELAHAKLLEARGAGCQDVMILMSDLQMKYPTQFWDARDKADAARADNIIVMALGVDPQDMARPDYVKTNVTDYPNLYKSVYSSDDIVNGLTSMIYPLCNNDPPPSCNSPVITTGESPDLGDAPDSTNHFGAQMTTYATSSSSVVARFPTVFDISTGSIVGPSHANPSGMFFGSGASRESDADTLPDDDIITNIRPIANRANLDSRDDGITFPIYITDCVQTTLGYTLTISAGMPDVRVNAWIDYNRDGDWADTLTCVDSGGTIRSVPEHVVINDQISLGSGSYALQTPSFWARIIDDPDSLKDEMWLRLSVAEQAAPSPGDGRGPTSGYEYGETEDYLIGHGSEDSHRYEPGVEP